jgi:hypothetical protein
MEEDCIASRGPQRNAALEKKEPRRDGTTAEKRTGYILKTSLECSATRHCSLDGENLFFILFAYNLFNALLVT